MIILVDKPSGITSYDVIRRLKKLYPKEKIGHAGTLDPLATGLLIVATGKDTKQLSSFLKLDKEYEATVELGIKTDTGDKDGKIIDQKKVSNITEELIETVINKMLGEREYFVPIYSALKRDGEPLYKKARRGEIIEPQTRLMKVISAKLVHYDDPSVTFIFKVGSGTYIRSLAEYIGDQLGTLATISKLRRMKIGDLSVENSILI